MPKLSDFTAYATNWTIQVKKAGALSVGAALDEGARYMRQYIAEGSPTGSDWHTMKNEANGYSDGARIGNLDPKWNVHPDAGNMFRSVQAEDAVVKGDQISGRFGWIRNQDEYFVKQDVGNYGTGKQIGMGLINKAQKSSKGVLQDLGAAVAAEETLREQAKINGFRVTGGGEWR